MMETDLSLLEAAGRMDQQALVAIFDRYATNLYNYALRMRSDPIKADNVVGDVFAQFLEQLAVGKEPQTNLRSHLYKMTYHLMVDGKGLSQQEASLELAEFEPTDGNGQQSKAANPDNKTLMETLIRAIKNHLTVNQRHVIILRYVEEFSLHETAEIVGKGLDDVKAIQNRAIGKLREVLDQKVRA